MIFSTSFGYTAVLTFWFNIDNWSNDRCNSECPNSRLHRQKRCKYFTLESLLVVLLRFKLHSSPVFQFVGCFARKTMGFSEIFCLAGWLAIAFSKALNPISLFYAIPNINVNVTCMTTPTFYLKRCLHKDNGKH